MKIVDVSKIEYFHVETDELHGNDYRRMVDGTADSWEIHLGDSWEVLNCTDEIESLFQEWLKQNK